DFHALRHTFITNLANGGVHPKTAQALARHSTITLTMDRYSHSLMGEQADALAALPTITATPETLQATGTDDARLASRLALSESFQETPGDSVRLSDNPVSMAGGDEKPLETKGKTHDSQGISSGGGGIRTLDELSLMPVFKTGAIGRSATPPNP